jgi:serine/threonine protein kinase
MGEYVPRLIAVRCGSDRFNLSFEIPHQTFFIEASADMPDTLKRRAIKVLEKLHAKGICHKDLNLENILIGADGNIYIYNFHHARYIIEQPVVFLERAKTADFAWEMRRLKFKLDYENAREKEKIRLGISIDRVRRNYLEIKKQEGDPSYQPKLVESSQIAKMNPPIDLSKYESWFSELDREPRRFIMPGQTADDFEWELKRFFNILQKMEDNDVAAGLQRTRVESSLGQVDQPKVEDILDDYMEDSIAISTDRRGCLKRKRPLEPDGGSKRPRQELQPLPRAPEPPTEGTPGEVERFKNDRLRSGT